MADASVTATLARPLVPVGSPPARRTNTLLGRFLRQRLALAAAAVLLLVSGVALTATVIAPGDPTRSAGRALLAPSQGHWFGTDDLGRDVFAGVVHGTRPTLLVGLATALTSGLLGTLIGGVAGSFGRWADDSLMRLTDLVQIIPRFFLALTVAALFGPSLLAITLLLGLTFWPANARLLRAQVLSLRERAFVLAATGLGATRWRVLVRHILPNALPVVVVQTTLQIGAAILVQAGLSFLGLGDRTTVSWGNMLNNAQPLIRLAWWPAVFPGLALTLTIIAANLVGDGLTAAMDPRADD